MFYIIGQKENTNWNNKELSLHTHQNDSNKKKEVTNPNAGKDAKKANHWHCYGIRNGTASLENRLSFKKLNIQIPCASEVNSHGHLFQINEDSIH